MKGHAILVPLALVMAAAAAACHGVPGRPSPRRASAGDFATLYAQNCAACHGSHGRGGAALALASPVYLAIAGDPVLSRVISQGVHGTPMPAFARTAGGALSDAQIRALVKGLRRWAQPGAAGTPPPYTPSLRGNAERGGQVFQTFCSSCHGPRGRGGQHAGSVVDPAYLALVSDQDLRSVVIAGRPELGAPDWRSDVVGRPMTDQEVTDVVSWLAMHRVRYPGRPYPAPRTPAYQGARQ